MVRGRVSFSPAKRTGEDHHPDRRGEFEGEDLRQCDQGQGREPEVLADEVAEVAQEMQAQAVDAHFADFAAGKAHGQDDGQPDEGAEHHHLEAVEFVRKRAPGNGHGGEGEDRSDHPEGGQKGPGGFCHSRYFM